MTSNNGITLFFGLPFDGIVYPDLPPQADCSVVGPRKLLVLLENWLGVQRAPTGNALLRLEYYRLSVEAVLDAEPTVFFGNSYQSNPIQTAKDLLDRRDELILNNWKPERCNESSPDRLQAFAKIEAKFQEYLPLAENADRWQTIFDNFNQELPVTEIRLGTPLHLLPPHLQQLFDRWKTNQPHLILTPYVCPLVPESDRDLDRLKAHFAKAEPGKLTLNGDGSLLIVKAGQLSHAGAFVSKLIAQNDGFRPLTLIPEKNNDLELALQLEGQPALGLVTSSLARPALQLLKLIQYFLWTPIAIEPTLQFLGMHPIPMDAALANRVAQHLSKTPGLSGSPWRKMIQKFNDFQAQHPEWFSEERQAQINADYQFWFVRDRYSSREGAPKTAVVSLVERLFQWSKARASNSEEQLLLTSQCRQLLELLEALPQDRFSPLEVDRLIGLVNEPSTLEFQLRECKALPFIYDASSFTASCKQLLWWSFTRSETPHFFSRWYPQEREWLEANNCRLETPELLNNRLIWERLQPFFNTEDQLILAVAEQHLGKALLPQLLMADLEAKINNLERITLDVDAPETWSSWKSTFTLPDQETVTKVAQQEVPPILNIDALNALEHTPRLSTTGLETFLDYPHTWVFKNKLQLRPAPILSISELNTLMGTLAHLVAERLLLQDFSDWTKEMVYEFISTVLPPLLEEQGMSLLSYGVDAQRVAFAQQLQRSLWALVSILQNNGWSVLAVEKRMKAPFGKLELLGIADLLLARGNERAVIDLKWSAASYYTSKMNNQQELQLVLYSYLTRQELASDVPYYGYFLLKNGKLLCRETSAFAEAEPLKCDKDRLEYYQDLLNKINKTFDWRWEQLTSGKIEVRTEASAKALEELYADEELSILELLEPKNEDFRFDDYKNLIQSIK